MAPMKNKEYIHIWHDLAQVTFPRSILPLDKELPYWPQNSSGSGQYVFRQPICQRGSP